MKKSAGIFTSAVKLEDNGSDEVGTGKRQSFEKSLNSVTLLGIFAVSHPFNGFYKSEN